MYFALGITEFYKKTIELDAVSVLKRISKLASNVEVVLKERNVTPFCHLLDPGIQRNMCH